MLPIATSNRMSAGLALMGFDPSLGANADRILSDPQGREPIAADVAKNRTAAPSLAIGTSAGSRGRTVVGHPAMAGTTSQEASLNVGLALEEGLLG